MEAMQVRWWGIGHRSQGYVLGRQFHQCLSDSVRAGQTRCRGVTWSNSLQFAGTTQHGSFRTQNYTGASTCSRTLPFVCLSVDRVQPACWLSPRRTCVHHFHPQFDLESGLPLAQDLVRRVVMHSFTSNKYSRLFTFTSVSMHVHTSKSHAKEVKNYQPKTQLNQSKLNIKVKTAIHHHI